MRQRFWWITFDVTDLLPENWQRDVFTVAAGADFRDYPRTPILTREATDVASISRGRVHAGQVLQDLPWLIDLYHGTFRELAGSVWAEPVVTAADDRYGVVLNVQRGPSMRFECHVDSNPLSGVLFCSDHRVGGELVVAHDPAAADLESIERDCSVIRPHAGHLLFFDGRDHPHYARTLLREADVRILAAMNFYTESFPESTRPSVLNHHLYGDPL
jgi:hypothetical protein